MKAFDEGRRRAFVFGNAAIDEVFRVRELPGPGESILGASFHTGLGGKGANQAIALARTGVRTTLVAAVGEDRYGREISEILAREDLHTKLVERPDLASDRSIILSKNDGENAIVTTNACAASISLEECASALSVAQTGDAVLLQGNLRGEVTAALCAICKRQSLFLVLNPSPFDVAFRDLVTLADAVFVNESEALELTGQTRAEAVESLLGIGVRQVVLTLGSEGALLGTTDETLQVPAESVDAVDVTGAGDCFEGVAVGSAITRGTRIDEDALRHASRAAAHTISGVGASSSFPDRRQIAAIISDRTNP